MNNKGQTLVLFVILVPFVLAICAFAFDSAYILIKDNELESIAKSSVRSIIEDSADYDKVIVVGHGMAFRVLKYIENIAPGEIIECEYEKGQEDCAYAFSSKIKFR